MAPSEPMLSYCVAEAQSPLHPQACMCFMLVQGHAAQVCPALVKPPMY